MRGTGHRAFSLGRAEPRPGTPPDDGGGDGPGSPCGGIGRRGRLKICCPQGRACSSQARGTTAKPPRSIIPNLQGNSVAWEGEAPVEAFMAVALGPDAAEALRGILRCHPAFDRFVE